jgi:hypothetical protein
MKLISEYISLYTFQESTAGAVILKKKKKQGKLEENWKS